MANFYGQFIGFGAGGVAPDLGKGFSSGGIIVAGDALQNIIDKYSFADESTCSDHGDLSSSIQYPAGHSATDYGFSCGGLPMSSTIRKWPFAGTGVSTTSAGDLSNTRRGAAGINNVGDQYGYTSGGYPNTGTLDVFNFTNTSGSFDNKTLSTSRYGSGGSESSTRGYVTGGAGAGTTVDMFIFASFANSTAERSLAVSVGETQATNSATHSYQMGGYGGSSNHIQKFSFADTSNATDVANLTGSRQYSSTFHSTTHAYCAGGRSPTLASTDKFSFATEGDASTTGVGDLTLARANFCGHQSVTT